MFSVIKISNEIVNALMEKERENYIDLDVWKQARNIYLTSSEFPNDERFGLTSQIRRASVSNLINKT